MFLIFWIFWVLMMKLCHASRPLEAVGYALTNCFLYSYITNVHTLLLWCISCFLVSLQLSSYLCS
ncbi:hypothetical protein HanXRQr2_Chr09g0396951 [Helianthus annuus]|uniref:Uncharacterized protein n=1 Tax=Helianthus annuus TaxID=4232 RepID=A0A9K3I6Y5_HELAN|nr:hypothetical protein HanXRQr2_Chr09g0396951 [Helianthus annuus]KAJ0893874.1 hypothetical protein HanPSC8_Chr09g0382711 [Helianthus annuus]